MNNLKWMGHTQTVIEMQKNQIRDLNFCDIKIACSGKIFSAHKVILSLCSDFFKEIFKACPDAQDPTIILPDIKSTIFENIMNFVYTGEVSLASSCLSDFLESINILGIKSAISFECHVNPKKEAIVTPKRVTNTNSNTKTISIPIANIGHHLTTSMEIEETTDVECSTIGETDTPPIVSPLKEGKKISETFVVEDQPASEINPSSDTVTEEFQSPTAKIQYLEVYNDKINQYTIQHIETETDECTEDDETGEDYILTENSDNTYTLSADSKDVVSEGSHIREIIYSSNNEETSFVKPTKIVKKYLPIKQETVQPELVANRAEAFYRAMEDVLNNGLSLQKASEKYGVSKTVLWRRVKKNPTYNKVYRENPVIQAAVERLERGESLKSVSEALNIPISTLHRHKIRLVNEGRLPGHYQVKRRTIESKNALKLKLAKAVEGCKSGMSQNHAATVFDVPKSTLWRYMRKMMKNELLRTKKELVDDSSFDDEIKIDRSDEIEVGLDDCHDNDDVDEDDDDDVKEPIVEHVDSRTDAMIVPYPT